MHDLVDLITARLTGINGDLHGRLDVRASRDNALDAYERADRVCLDLPQLDVLNLGLAGCDNDGVLPFEFWRETILHLSAIDHTVAHEATLDRGLASLLLVEAALLHHKLVRGHAVLVKGY